MLGMIMAGGAGERLRPLTCACPKPMVPLLDKPVLAYALELFKAHGVSRAALTLGYLPDAIMDCFGDGSEFDISLKYYLEKKPLGTAGGVKQARDFLTETFCVLSGDGVTDVNLTDAYNFHKQRGALATMVLKRVSNPTEYGLVRADADGRVRAFVEKPSWSGVNTDTANTGIYLLEPEILEMIPDGAYDFGRELFPALLARAEKVYGYVTDAYWCDIGDIPAYLGAQRDALNGRFSGVRAPEDGVFRMPGAVIHEDAVLEFPVYIGCGARIEAGAHIGAHSVVGAGARVCENASVKRGIVCAGALVGAGAQLRGCVLAKNSAVHEGASVFEECVIGENSTIGARACVKPGAKVWPGKRVPEGVCVFENLVWGQRDARAFHGATMRTPTPEDATRAGRALAWKLGLQTVLVGRSASAVAAAQERALAAGLAAQGARVYTAGECTLAQLRHALSCVRADAAVYAQSDGATPMRAGGTYLSAEDKRKLDAALIRQDMPPPYSGITRPIESAGRFDLPYLAFLETAAYGALRRARAAVFAQDKQLLYLADHAFARAGFAARVEWEEDMMDLEPGEVGVYLSLDGEHARFADEDGLLSDAQNQLLAAWAMAENGEKTIYAPPGETRGLDALASAMNVRVEYAKADAWARELREKSPYQYHMRFDGLFLAINALCHISESARSPRAFFSALPLPMRASRKVEIGFEKRGEALRKLMESAPGKFVRDDWFFQSPRGCAWIRPDEDRPLCEVTAEARDAEFANEICDLFSGLLEGAATDAPNGPLPAEKEE